MLRVIRALKTGKLKKSGKSARHASGILTLQLQCVKTYTTRVNCSANFTVKFSNGIVPVHHESLEERRNNLLPGPQFSQLNLNTDAAARFCFAPKKGKQLWKLFKLFVYTVESAALGLKWSELFRKFESLAHSVRAKPRKWNKRKQRERERERERER